MGWFSNVLNSIWLLLLEVQHSVGIALKKLKNVSATLEQLTAQSAAAYDLEKQNAEKLDRVLSLLVPLPPVKFTITYIGENAMGNVVKAALDFQLLDNGSATATLTPVDAVGNAASLPAGASVPAWTSSDPAVAVSAAPDGMSATLTPSGALATGVIISASSTLADGTVIKGDGTPIDVVAGPAASFKIVEQ